MFSVEVASRITAALVAAFDPLQTRGLRLQSARFGRSRARRAYPKAAISGGCSVHLNNRALYALGSPQQLAGIVAFQRSEAFRRNSVEQYGQRISFCSLILRYT